MHGERTAIRFAITNILFTDREYCVSVRLFYRNSRQSYVVNEPVVMVSMMRRPIMSSDLARTFVNFVS